MPASPYLVISDLQIPFEHSKALSFCAYLRKHYKIDDDHILNAGDEVDQLNGSAYPKDPDGIYTPTHEIQVAREKLKEWAAHFPRMKLATSNHGMRWAKKASAAEIPSQMMRTYQEVLQTPPGWQWKDHWIFKEKNPFMMLHGMGYSGQFAHRTAALDMGMSVIMGHLTHAGISHIRTAGQKLWGMCVACMIDRDAYAFKYGKDHRFKPCTGAGLVFNEGATPVWIPLE